MTPFAYTVFTALFFIIAFVLGLLGYSEAAGKASSIFTVVGAMSLVLALALLFSKLQPRRTR